MKKVEEEMKLSLIRDIMKLSDKQVEYILNNLKEENSYLIKLRSGGLQNANF